MDNRETEKENILGTSVEGSLAGSGSLAVNKEPLSPVVETGSGSYTKTGHPSRNLETRSKGYGIGGGYEKSYAGNEPGQQVRKERLYSALSHGGYYGGGTTARRFEVGQAGFREELIWYRKQYGEKTSKYGNED